MEKQKRFSLLTFMNNNWKEFPMCYLRALILGIVFAPIIAIVIYAGADTPLDKDDFMCKATHPNVFFLLR